MKRLLALIALLLAFVCPALAQDYPDGIYRGFYYDGGIEQIAIQFELKDGIFTSLIYRGVKYKDGDYMNEDASDAQKAILHQYRQLAEYLVGKDISAIDDLYSPYDIVEDLDAVTTATMKAGKLISALWDGLNLIKSSIPRNCLKPSRTQTAFTAAATWRTAANRLLWNLRSRTIALPKSTT